METLYTNLDRILYQVNKPARYTGGEWNSIKKDWDKTGVHIALAFPDVYEIGMSNMAIPIPYRRSAAVPIAVRSRKESRPPREMSKAGRANWRKKLAKMRGISRQLFSITGILPPPEKFPKSHGPCFYLKKQV